MTSESTAEQFDPALWVWGAQESKPRLLHSMIRVKEIDAALRFYVDGLGMKELFRFNIASRRVTGLYLGFGDYWSGGVLELAYTWDVEEPYSHGTGYGHIAIGVPDVIATVAKLESMGAVVDERPRRLLPGGPRVAFVRDPDGYAVELIQTQRDI